MIAPVKLETLPKSTREHWTMTSSPKSEKRRALELDRDLMISLYRNMVLIREFELKAREVFRIGRMPGFIHVYIGEEAVAAGVCAQLRIDDYVASTHRGHGHALAKGVSPREAMAEPRSQRAKRWMNSMSLYFASALFRLPIPSVPRLTLILFPRWIVSFWRLNA